MGTKIVKISEVPPQSNDTVSSTRHSNDMNEELKNQINLAKNENTLENADPEIIVNAIKVNVYCNADNCSENENEINKNKEIIIKETNLSIETKTHDVSLKEIKSKKLCDQVATQKDSAQDTITQLDKRNATSSS